MRWGREIVRVCLAKTATLFVIVGACWALDGATITPDKPTPVSGGDSAGTSPLDASVASPGGVQETRENSDGVTRSISGHVTETMQRHYSTVTLEEQRRGLANVLDLIRPAQPLDSEWAGSPADWAGSAGVKPGEERKPSI
jgi:hypothetical protein